MCSEKCEKTWSRFRYLLSRHRPIYLTISTAGASSTQQDQPTLTQRITYSYISLNALIKVSCSLQYNRHLRFLIVSLNLSPYNFPNVFAFCRFLTKHFPNRFFCHFFPFPFLSIPVFCSNHYSPVFLLYDYWQIQQHL